MYYLALQTTYDHLEIALLQNNECIDTIIEDKKLCSSIIILRLDQLLSEHNLTIKDCSFIAVNQGPAPFTSLRVIIATANGISFAAGVPLVGVDGLEAFIKEYTDPAWPITVALLNAFNNDVYYAIQTPDQKIKTGYENIEIFLHQIKENFPQTKIRFLGGGTQLFGELIKNAFPDFSYIPDPLPLDPSILQIGAVGLEQWNQKNNISNQLLPLYLKSLRYKKSIS